ncbi:MAG: prefoldin subunit [Methanomassiliicoccales archaeon]
MDDISPKLQNQIAQFQQVQQQLQQILNQKFRMEAQLKEMDLTIDELKKNGWKAGAVESYSIFKYRIEGDSLLIAATSLAEAAKYYH